jgi:hypothetical protein
MSICRSPGLHPEDSTLDPEHTQGVHPQQASRVEQQASDLSLNGDWPQIFHDIAVTYGPDGFEEYMEIDPQTYRAQVEGTEPYGLPEDFEDFDMQDLLYTTQLTDFD